MQKRPKKLMEQVQDVIRLKHYSYSTDKTYIGWIRRYVFFHNQRHTIQFLEGIFYLHINFIANLSKIASIFRKIA